jgi:hypothetical protein
MFFQRIRRLLQEKSEALLLSFEIAHFVIDVIVVFHVVVNAGSRL